MTTKERRHAFAACCLTAMRIYEEAQRDGGTLEMVTCALVADVVAEAEQGRSWINYDIEDAIGRFLAPIVRGMTSEEMLHAFNNDRLPEHIEAAVRLHVVEMTQGDSEEDAR